ncbi:hypothetical protein BHE74_00058816 [Ensete ventricosum]|nr:hypothetical protein GW17_00028581 [Ensete ventricosum]RWW36181.1 hypothetical protein BHE74_00058816 [Ensete ventricosum]
MRLGIRQECIGSLPRLYKGVRQKKIETNQKIVGGSRKTCREYRVKDWTMRWELVGRSLGLYRRYPEDRQEHARRSPEEDHETRCWRS